MKFNIFALSLLLCVLYINCQYVVMESQGINDSEFISRVAGRTINPDIRKLFNYGANMDKTMIDGHTAFLNDNFKVTSISTDVHGGLSSNFVQVECDGTCITNAGDFHDGVLRFEFTEPLRAVAFSTYMNFQKELIRVFDTEGDLIESDIVNLNEDAYQTIGLYNNMIYIEEEEDRTAGVSAIELEGSFWAIYLIDQFYLAPEIITNPDTLPQEVIEGDDLLNFQVKFSDVVSAGSSDPTYDWVITDIDNNQHTFSGNDYVYIDPTYIYNGPGPALGISVRATSSDGLGFSEYFFQVNVINGAPTVDFSIPSSQVYNVDEGDMVTISAFATDPSQVDGVDPSLYDDVFYSWDLVGNNEFIQIGDDPSVTSVDFDASFIDGGNSNNPTIRRVCTKAFDEDGAYSEASCRNVQVNNVAPWNVQISNENGSNQAQINANQNTASITLDASAEDIAEDLQSMTYTWTTNESPSPQLGPRVNFIFSANLERNVTVTLQAQDKDGGIGTATYDVYVPTRQIGFPRL